LRACSRAIRLSPSLPLSLSPSPPRSLSLSLCVFRSVLLLLSCVFSASEGERERVCVEPSGAAFSIYSLGRGRAIDTPEGKMSIARTEKHRSNGETSPTRSEPCWCSGGGGARLITPPGFCCIPVLSPLLVRP